MKFIYRENLEEIPFLQKAAQSALAIRRHPREVHTRLVEVYWEYYRKLKDEIYLEFAYTHIGAFLRSDFDFKEAEPLFTEVIQAVGYQSLQEYMRAIGYKAKRVRLTENRVYQILGNGYMYRNDARIAKKEIVDEIIQKVVNKELGTYEYLQEYNGLMYLSYLIVEEHGACLINNKGEQYKLFLE